MTALEPPSLTRTFSRVTRTKPAANVLVEFAVVDEPPADTFHLTIGAWKHLGRPERIAVTVVALEAKP